MKINKRFYIYALLDPRKLGPFFYKGIKFKFEYEPFYIGKGQTNRQFAHFSELSSGISRNKFKLNLMKKIKKSGLKTLTSKIEENLSNSEAINKEVKYIKLIGRRDLLKGPLTNLTDGGEGAAGWHHNNISSKKISESNRKRKISIKTKKKISKSLKENPVKWTKQRRNAKSKSMSGNKNFFHKMIFRGPSNHMYGKKLNKKRRSLLSKLASNRIGGLNPNSKYNYCAYNHENKRIIHGTPNIGLFIGCCLYSHPSLWKILRYKKWTIIRDVKGMKKCPCKRLLRIDIKKVSSKKNRPISGYLKPRFQDSPIKKSLPAKPWTFLKGISIDRIKKMYLSGATSIIISKKVGCSVSAVINILKHNDVTIRKVGLLPRYNYEKIIKLYDSGMKCKSIAEKMKCSLGVIERALKDKKSKAC